jgi:prepilin-type N-terminal cleavage/methylation domain-containing protein/prepilin-type processing-associated H-X9-DG protein
MSTRTKDRGAFTLVELLVVIGIIALLIAILLPTLSKVRENARRVECASRLRQLAAAVHLYANEHRGKVPPGNRDNNNEEHCIWLSQSAFDDFVATLDQRKMLACPHLQETQPNYPTNNIGWVIGYDYLGGHVKLRAAAASDWLSPLQVSEGGQPAIFCDMNDWSPVDGWTAIGHRKSGPGGFLLNTGGATAKDYGSAGGNVAYLDGSVVWRDISVMSEHQTYSGSATAYRSMW